MPGGVDTPWGAGAEDLVHGGAEGVRTALRLLHARICGEAVVVGENVALGEDVLEVQQARGGRACGAAQDGAQGGDVGGQDVQLGAPVAGGVELAGGGGAGGEERGVGCYGALFVEELAEEEGA